MEGNGWVPSLPEFIQLGRPQIDYEAAYFRCLNKSPDGRLETWVYEKAYYNIRGASDDRARKMHQRYMKEAEELESRGKLKLNDEELIGLPVHSVKNVVDVEREKFKGSGCKNPFEERIKNLIKNKKTRSE